MFKPTWKTLITAVVLLIVIMTTMAVSAMADTIIGRVIFDSNGGRGEMSSVEDLASGTLYLAPECKFYKTGNSFTHWLGSDGNEYAPGDTVTLDFSVNTELTLTAVWAEDSGDVEVNDGKIDLYLRSGESATLTGLPGGSYYQVWEETPDGWQLVSQMNPSGTIIPNEDVNAVFTNEYVPGTATISLVARKSMNGQPPEAGAFSFNLYDADGNIVKTASNLSTGFIQFSPLVFTAPGTYVYTIQEVRGEDESIAYDMHQEVITITVSDDGAGNLTASSDMDGVALFENKMKPGELKITKNTEGGGNPNETFTFELTLTNEYGESLDNIVILEGNE